MKPIGINTLSAEDAAVILELAPILDIGFVKSIGASERKFYIETKQGIKRMLRITPIKDYRWVKDNDRVFEHIATAGINVSRQASEGFCSDGALVYQLWTWIDGEDLCKALPRMSPAEQFAAGLKCGEAARKIHALPMIDSPEPWGIRYKREVEKTIQSYNEKSAKSPEKDLLVRYLQDNIELLDSRPTVFSKGDWNIANLMITPDGQIWVIDLGAYSGDPWWEFWEVGDDAHFNTGQIKGYFEGEPPAEYFPLLSII
jgi:serine/threonine-protein kinase